MSSPSTSTSTSPSTSGSVFRFVVKWILLPYLIGWFLSDYVPTELADKVVGSIMATAGSSNHQVKKGTNVSSVFASATRSAASTTSNRELEEGYGDLCWQRFLASLDMNDAKSVQ
ncbi:expressed unknown protein (Partial), partial [Seminavis robusta]|eukprot:Sro555_g165840.1 n/a (114) ;mRNA; f:59619-59961